ncbi:MAG: translation elongation factor Ts [candidate division WOR-3 bacterium]|nr:translation elongation factor Ts [candidate division WOR-3 bacterium]MCX7947267.1 translation elongation factor Ts [candidate division WOR-3 bacterium]MDW8150176.1 translation elongation factor Ts [candidate division WOR-3 bacterium]
MADIKPELLKELRERTGAGLMDCKKALIEADGDIEKAVEILRKMGIAKSEKKLTKEARQGLVASYLSEDRKLGILVELNCETDFVSATDDFKKLLNEILNAIKTYRPKTIDEAKLIKLDTGDTIEDAIKLLISKVGENIILRRFSIFESKNGFIEIYVHPGSMLASMVEIEPHDEKLYQFSRDIAMQIAAMSAISISEEDMPKDILEREKEIYREQAIKEGKPEKVIDKIVEGKIKAFLSEKVLLNQQFIKDNTKSVLEYKKEVESSLNLSVNILRFVRYKVGEE